MNRRHKDTEERRPLAKQIYGCGDMSLSKAVKLLKQRSGQSLRASPADMFSFPNIRYGPVMSTVLVASLRGLVATFQHCREKSLCLEILEKSLVRYGRNEYGAITGVVCTGL